MVLVKLTCIITKLKYLYIMKKIILSAFVLILGLNISFGQRALVFSTQELLESFQVNEELEGILHKLKKKSEDPELNLKAGFCYLLIPDKKEKSVKYLEKAIKFYGTKKKNAERKAKTKVLLAQAYRLTGDLDKAQEEYKKLKSELKDYPNLRKLLEQDKQLCTNAMDLMMNPKYVNIVNFDVINSKYQDHSPMLLYDTVLIFTSKKKTSSGDKKQFAGNFSEDVFFSSDVSGHWSKPLSLARKLETKENLANCGISPDKKTIYLYQNFDVWEIHKKKGKWQKPKKSKLSVNSSDSDDKHMSFTADGNTIYFSSKKPHGARGGFDIYKIVKNGTVWSDPIILGDNINTIYDEDGPCIASDGSLYFSSKGHNSMGGFDIFRAKPDGKGGFKKAVNLGFPTNSPEHDVYYFLSRDNKRAFFTSTRAGGKGKADIYMINYADFLMVKGCAMKKGGEVAGVLAMMNAIPTKKLIEKPKLKDDCRYAYLIDRNKDYFMSVEAKDYYFETFTFQTLGVEFTEQELQKVILQPIKRSKIFKQYVRECYSEMNNQTELFLNTLVRFLNENPDLIADMSMENKNISQMYVDYLKKAGIGDNQISEDVFQKDADGGCVVTIHDKMPEPEVVEVVEVVEIKPEPVVIQEKRIIYTIQIGAFRLVDDPKHWFFQKQNPLKRDGIDDINRYTLGVYNTREEAEAKLPFYQNLFWDAFIREIEWYKDGEYPPIQ